MRKTTYHLLRFVVLRFAATTMGLESLLCTSRVQEFSYTTTFLLILLLYDIPINERMHLMSQGGLQTGSIHVRFHGMKSDQGVVRIALFNATTPFPSDKPFKGYVAFITNGEASIEMNNIPYGEYAIAAFHDENNNEKLDRNIVGIPTEGYGFSNNARGILGPPSFESSKFTLQADKVLQTIHIR